MKTFKLLNLLIMVVAFAITANGQGKPEKKTDPDKQNEIPLDDDIQVRTSRIQDIRQLEQFQLMFEESVKKGNAGYTGKLQNEIVRVFKTEIKRSNNNIKDMEAGKIDGLEEWYKENKPDAEINVALEIQVLTNRIRYEKSVLALFEKTDVSKLKDDRNLSTVVGYINGFRSAMTRSMKYEVKESKVVPKDQSGVINNKTEETGFIVKKENNAQMASDDPRIKSWRGSAKMRAAKFAEEQAALSEAIKTEDYRTANRKFRSLVGLMQDEINSNNWILGMINTGNVDKGTVDTNQLGSKLKKQKSLLKSAQTLLFSTEQDIKKNKEKALELAGQFNDTLE